MDVEEFVKTSQAKNIWDKVQGSKYYISHLSDVLRVLIVKNFGGIYLTKISFFLNIFEEK